MVSWKKTKRTNYGLKVIRQDLWGKYARKRANNETTSKHERLLKHVDDLVHKTSGSQIFWLFNQLNRKREGIKLKFEEEIKHRAFRTRKLLQILFENIKIHNIKIHLKKAGIKNGFGYSINFMKMFERRIDVMCLRCHFFYTLREAKQFIKNGFILINNQIIKSCHYILKDKDIITIREDKRLEYKEKYLSNLLNGQILRGLPPYLRMNLETFRVIFIKELFEVSKILHFADFPWTRFPNMRKKP
jgi:ribosomal protein S4